MYNGTLWQSTIASVLNKLDWTDVFVILPACTQKHFGLCSLITLLWFVNELKGWKNNLHLWQVIINLNYPLNQCINVSSLHSFPLFFSLYVDNRLFFFFNVAPCQRSENWKTAANTQLPYLHLSEMPRRADIVSPVCLCECVCVGFYMKLERSGEVQVDRQISSYCWPAEGGGGMSLWQS